MRLKYKNTGSRVVIQDLTKYYIDLRGLKFKYK